MICAQSVMVPGASGPVSVLQVVPQAAASSASSPGCAYLVAAPSDVYPWSLPTAAQAQQAFGAAFIGVMTLFLVGLAGGRVLRAIHALNEPAEVYPD